MRILLAGSSGFLGTLLRERLTRGGHTVVSLVRRPAGSGESTWDPYDDQLDVTEIETADVVINLAGSPIMGNPHSAKWAAEVRSSRVTTTRALAGAIAESRRKPAFLAGNAIGFYGDHGSAPVPESASSVGDALLTSVCRDWQEATNAAAEAGARLVVLRTAPVLDSRSSPLKQLLLLFKVGLGGPIGGGRQYFPVVSTRDWLDAVVFAAEHADLSGPVNLCVPRVPTNAEFTTALAHQVHRPALLRVPAPAVRLAAGPMAPEVLGSVRAVPAALQEAGYTFSDPDVTAVLAAALAR